MDSFAPRRTAALGRLVAFASALALAAPPAAIACSTDDATYLESFLDATCLATPLTGVTLDARGGLRLDTAGSSQTLTWDTDTEFQDGVVHDAVAFAQVGVSTLAQSGSGVLATLRLPQTTFPLTPSAQPILGPPVSVAPDGDSIDGPSVIRTPSGYVMYHAATAEDGSASRIFRATSTDGKVWTRVATPNTAVLTPTPGTFDEHGVAAPHVVYDAADPATPYRMWYAGRGAVFGAIGYATSLDGITWTKRAGPVVDHGIGGSADSFAASDPSVIRDGGVWKMWYTGDDSNWKRIAYATSTDGVTWSKGGSVLAPEDPGVNANLSEGAFAPTVYKTGSTYVMLFGGRKLTSGTYATKILSATSADGVTWGGLGVALNPSGTANTFDFANLEAPFVLDDGVPGAERYKLYYSGTSGDATDSAHARIGLATSLNGSSFAKFAGATAGSSVLDIAPFEAPFDARSTSGLGVIATGANSGSFPFTGFYSGTRGADFLPRIGLASSTDGATFTRVAGGQADGSLFAPGTVSAPDARGQLDPAGILDGTTYRLYFTGVAASGALSIVHTTTSAGSAADPVPGSTWSARVQVLSATGGGFEAAGVADPSVIQDGTNYVMYYSGISSGGVRTIGRIVSAAPTFTSPTSRSQVLTTGALGTYDAAGAQDPVVVKVAGGDYRMVYTAVDAAGVERLAYATSSDGIAWTRGGAVQNPSLAGGGFDEVAVRASGFVRSGGMLHVYLSGVDGTGRIRAGHATASYPTPASPASGIPSGWRTYQVGDASTSVRDWRQISRLANGKAELWLSVLQPYSAAGGERWSAFFPVTTASSTELLDLLLTVRGLRFQTRLADPSTTPSFDRVAIDHAPVAFQPSGTTRTLDIAPATTLLLTSWGTLTVDTETLAPSGGGAAAATVSVRDAASDAELLAPIALQTAGTTTRSLAGIDAAAHRRLRLRLTLSSDGPASPRITALRVAFTAQPLTGPVAILSATPTNGNAGMLVQFDGSVSAVPGGRTIASYEWDFDGDGVVDRTTRTPTTDAGYPKAGTFRASLTITDSTGAVSAAATKTITVVDPSPPTVSITGSGQLVRKFQRSRTLKLTWAGIDDQSGIARYDLSMRTATIGGSFGAPKVLLAGTRAVTKTLTLKPGTTACFTVTATNGQGMRKASVERCTAIPLAAGSMTTAGGSWLERRGPNSLFGRYRTTRTRGATLIRTNVLAKRIAVIATKGRRNGTVAVYFAGRRVRTIRLTAARTRWRQPLPVITFRTPRRGTVKIVVISSGAPVSIEGLGISKV